MDLEKLWKEKLEGRAWQVKDEFLSLLEFMQAQGIESVLEIGCYKGGTALGFVEIGCNVTTVDIERQPEVSKIEAFNSNNFCFIYRDEIVQGLTGEFDMLFIDGDHSYEACKKDYEEFSPYVKKGGLIVFHDILDNELHRNQGCEVWKVWDEVRNEDSFEFITDKTWGGTGVMFK